MTLAGSPGAKCPAKGAVVATKPAVILSPSFIGVNSAKDPSLRSG